MMLFKYMFLLSSSFFLGLLCNGQILKKEKWRNKDKSVYTISFSIMPTRVEDTAKCGVSIKMFELTEDGCKRIEGWAEINGKKNFVYDSTWFEDSEGEKDPSNFFFTLLTEGVYEIKADAGKEFYLIKTGHYKLLKRTAYTFYFYFVRRDSLKRN